MSKSEPDASVVNICYRYGAVPLGDGTVRFRLWAPGVKDVSLEVFGKEPVSMHACEGGFFERVCECSPGSRYVYRVGPDTRVPDPASRLQDGDVHDASIVVNTTDYRWRHNEWRGRPWSETVLYEAHAGLLGGFRGVQERLAHLAELGITAIELMPVADFPGPRNWGYDGVLPYAPDCAYGSPDDLKLLIDTAHGMGIQVFLDVVYNHFGPDGNYLPVYAPQFFRHDMNTPWGPAIDFRKPQVREFFAENALYWLQEYRFDGLRLDAVHAISERDWLPEMARFVRSRIQPGRHVHLVLENDDNCAGLLRDGFDAQWNDDAHHVLHHILTGENHGYYSAYSDDVTRKLMRFLAEGFVYQGEPNVVRDGEPRGEPSGDLPPTAFVFFLQNHDQTGNRALGERLLTLSEQDPERLNVAVALQILTPHIPMLFMGEEYGATAPFLYFTSFSDAALAQAVRDGRRGEFADFHAFATELGQASIPDPNAIETWARSQALPPTSGSLTNPWLRRYKELLHIRSRFLTPYLNPVRCVSVQKLGELAIGAKWRLSNDSLWRIYCNFSAHDVEVSTHGETELTTFATSTCADASVHEGRLLATSLVATIETSTPPRADVVNKKVKS